mmetsp:Transcript_55987/g.111243  ORF Transcript_55987/g.111243 Transcript_55987/m.111243 type:complete len:92 (+) Transcript_55987:27-302(+)
MTPRRRSLWLRHASLNETYGRCSRCRHPWLSMVHSTQFAGADEKFATRLVSTLSAMSLASTAAPYSCSLTNNKKTDHGEASGKQEVYQCLI